MKRVIVTGGTGFVGANLVRRLLHEGHEVHLLVRRDYAPWRIEAIRSDVQLHEVDLADAESLFPVVNQIRPTWIFHLATHGAYSSQNNLSQIVQTNILGTINLVETCIKVGFESFVNTGSSSEYGFKAHAPSEQEWLEPNSYYAVGKASATLFCRYTAQSRKLHLPTLRLYSVYGPYEEPTRLMPALIVRGLRGQLPPLVNPEIARDYVYVDDISEAYLLAATKSGQELGAVYNLGSGVQTSLREVVAAARKLMDIKVEPAWGAMPNRQWDTNVWVANNQKARDELGWRPQYSFERGLKQTLSWLRNNLALLSYYEEQRAKVQ